MKLNFNQPFLDLDGKEIRESDTENTLTNQGKTLSKSLSASFDAKETDVLKYWEWAVKCHKGEVLELDKSDQKKLKDFIEKTQFNVLVKYQLLENFEQVEKEPKGK